MKRLKVLHLLGMSSIEFMLAPYALEGLMI